MPTMRVLYVDDDRINALLFRETCRIAPDLAVETAGSGAEAMRAAAEFAPQVLVIDLHLPDTDGLALLPALRALPGLAAVPAYLCTADEVDRLAGPAQAAGFQGCWAKPVDLRAMLDEFARLAAPPAR
jgi:CheY-like chemotaxis protein